MNWPLPEVNYKPKVGDLLEIPVWNLSMYTERWAWPDRPPDSFEICEVVVVKQDIMMILAIPPACGGQRADFYDDLKHLNKTKRIQHNFCLWSLNAFIRKIEGSW